MSAFILKTPVAFLIFNRPDCTRQVFEAIRAARPPVLLIVADGPRAGHPTDESTCTQTRAVIEGVDWPCDVRTNYAEKNMGCRDRVASGLQWVFEQVEEAIVLEDDCLPHPTFFQFCQELLVQYRYDTRVGMISGNNFFANGYTRQPSSYYFSRYFHIWGWAGWRRAFQHYDLSMKQWPELSTAGWLEDLFNDSPAEVAYWRDILTRVHSGNINTWDYQMMYSYWLNGMCAIAPSKNLVSNIGFGHAATHTHDSSPLANLPVSPMRFPLKAPTHFSIDKLADEQSSFAIFSIPHSRPSSRARQLFRTADPSAAKETTRDHFSKIMVIAMGLLEQSDPASALELFQVCIKNNYLERNIFYGCAIASLYLNDVVSARRFFETELALYPDNQEARDMYGRVS